MERNKFYIGIRNEASSSTLELYFTDYIFNDFDWITWEESNLVQDVIDKVNAAQPSKILVTINSLGGDVMIGLALYNFLKKHKAKIEVEVIGFAASIASIIAMSANKGKLRMANNGFMIIHAASSGIYGNAKQMREEADILDTVTHELADIYAQRTGKTPEDFTAMWADGGDVWLTGREAKDLGLVDELMNATTATAKINLQEYGYKNIPGRIAASISQNKISNMAFQKTISIAKADGFAVVDGGFLLTEEHLRNIEDALVNEESANQSLTSVTAELSALKTSTSTQIDELNQTIAANAGVLAEKDARISELEAQVAELGKQPSGNGTTITTKEDVTHENKMVPSYADPNSNANKWFDKQAAFVN